MYTSKDKVANLLGVVSTEIQDDWLAWADEQVHVQVGYRYDETEVVERYDGTGTDELLVDNYPITSITKIEYLMSQYTLLGTWLELETKYVVFYAKEGRIRMVEDLSGVTEVSCFDEGVQNWRITYKYGCSVIPDIIEFLATLFAAQMYNINKTGASGVVSSERIGAYSISYDTGTAATVGVDSLIKDILTKIRNSGIGLAGL